MLLLCVHTLSIFSSKYWWWRRLLFLEKWKQQTWKIRQRKSVVVVLLSKFILTQRRQCQSALRWLHKSSWYPPHHFYQSTSSHSRTAWCLLQWSRGWNKCVSTQNGHSAYRRPNSPCKISLRYKIRKKSHSILNYPCPVQEIFVQPSRRSRRPFPSCGIRARVRCTTPRKASPRRCPSSPVNWKFMNCHVWSDCGGVLRTLFLYI